MEHREVTELKSLFLSSVFLLQVLVFNSTATILYLVAAIVEASLVGHGVKGRHNYNSWAASTVSLTRYEQLSPKP